MERRELLKMIALLTGGVVIGGDVFLSGCKTNNKKSEEKFSTANIAMLDEVGETIIPTTNTPGAKAAEVGKFMQVYVTDCLSEPEQNTFTNGITALNGISKKMHDKDFVECSPQQRHDVLIALEQEAKAFNLQLKDKEKSSRDSAKAAMKEFKGEPAHYYTMMKQMILLGYFTSEIGSKQALRFLPIPGKYDGAYPYKKGDKAWAI